MQGINAYYLLVEAYRHVQRNSGRDRRAMVREYLIDKLRLPALRDQSTINSIRYWAFNDYPALDGLAVAGATDGHLWKSRQDLEPLAFEVLGHLTEILDDLDFSLVPVLANYWPNYGGILRYLVWAGELNPKDYIDALCFGQEEELYLKHTLTFFTSPAAEQMYRQHIGRILPLLTSCRSVRIIELMNEPRGKNPLSLKDSPLPDGRTSADILASWLNRQASWIRKHFLSSSSELPYLSSGEEGWLRHPLSSMNLHALVPGGQYYEGIDLLKNMTTSPTGLTIGSIHMYPHRIAHMSRKNICGIDFQDKRGWEHLARGSGKRDKKQFMALADEWIISRSRVLQGIPWYMGEVGWCWPDNQSSSTLLQERRRLYTHWGELARQHGASGLFLWMLDGLEHKDAFYGMSHRDVVFTMKEESA